MKCTIYFCIILLVKTIGTPRALGTPDQGKSQPTLVESLVILCVPFSGRSRGGDWAIALSKTYESKFIHHDFAQFRKQHSRYKAILPSIVLSMQFCEVYFISLAVVNP